MHNIVRRILAVVSTFACLHASAAEPSAVDVRPSQVAVGGVVYEAIWYLPQAVPLGLVVMEHGFTRRCENLRNTTVKVAETRLVVLCLSAPMAGGNLALAEALAADIAGGALRLPEDGELPIKVLAAGHSAGSVFAARLASTLLALAPDRVRGLVMMDPVATGSLRDDILMVAASGIRPVLAITTNPSPCNAFNSAHADLMVLSDELKSAGQDPFVGVQLIRGSSHVDFEGEDSDVLSSALCGWPRRDNVEAARTLVATWASDIVQGLRSPSYYPGGSYVERLFTRDRAALIAP